MPQTALRLARAGRERHHGGCSRGSAVSTQHPGHHAALLQPGRGHGAGNGSGADQAQWPETSQPGGQPGGRLAMRQPIMKPDGLGWLRHAARIESGQNSAMVRRPGQWPRRLQDGARGARRQYRRYRTAGHLPQDDGPAGLRSLAYRRQRRCFARAPVRCTGPARIHQDQHRPLAAGPQPVAGVQHRPGEPDDHRRQRQHPQRQQPPRRLVGLAIRVLQTQQQTDPGEGLQLRARRDGPQQPPQHWQRDQCRQQPGAGESQDAPECAQREHQAPPNAA